MAVEIAAHHTLPSLERIFMYSCEICDLGGVKGSLSAPRLTELATFSTPLAWAPPSLRCLQMTTWSSCSLEQRTASFLQRLELDFVGSGNALPSMPSLTYLKVGVANDLTELAQPQLFQLELGLAKSLTRLEAEKLTHLCSEGPLIGLSSPGCQYNLPSLRSLAVRFTDEIDLPGVWSQLTALAYGREMSVDGCTIPETPRLEKLVLASLRFKPQAYQKILASRTTISSLTLPIPKRFQGESGPAVEQFISWLDDQLASLPRLRVLGFEYNELSKRIREYDYGQLKKTVVGSGSPSRSFHQLMFDCTERRGIVLIQSSPPYRGDDSLSQPYLSPHKPPFLDTFASL
jgi:hypothetical protein